MIAGDYGGIGVSLEQTTYCFKSISKIVMWLSVIKMLLFLLFWHLHITMCIAVYVSGHKQCSWRSPLISYNLCITLRPPELTSHETHTNTGIHTHTHTHTCTQSCNQQFQTITILQHWVERLCIIWGGLPEVARSDSVLSIWRGCSWSCCRMIWTSCRSSNSMMTKAFSRL